LAANAAISSLLHQSYINYDCTWKWRELARYASSVYGQLHRHNIGYNSVYISIDGVDRRVNAVFTFPEVFYDSCRPTLLWWISRVGMLRRRIVNGTTCQWFSLGSGWENI